MAPADESTTEKEKKRYKGAVKQPQQKKGRNRVGKFFFFTEALKSAEHSSMNTQIKLSTQLKDLEFAEDEVYLFCHSASYVTVYHRVSLGAMTEIYQQSALLI